MKKFNRKIIIEAPADEVFAFMDNIENMGMHMTKPNVAMMGSRLRVEWLSLNKTGAGAKYRWKGNIMGMKINFIVEVTRWIAGREKVWETIGPSKLIVLSWFRMYLILSPLDKTTTQTELGIDYTIPKGNILGFFLAGTYAAWCVNSMLKDLQIHFSKNRKRN